MIVLPKTVASQVIIDKQESIKYLIDLASVFGKTIMLTNCNISTLEWIMTVINYVILVHTTVNSASEYMETYAQNSKMLQ